MDREPRNNHQQYPATSPSFNVVYNRGIMKSNYKKHTILLFLILIALLSSCGESSVAENQTTLSATHTAQSNTNAQPTTAPTTNSKTTSKSTPTIATLHNGRFITLPPKSPLPSDAACAASVRKSSWEPRPDNTVANHTNLYAQGKRLTGSYLKPYGYEARVTGNFTGTTDEILQWGACKWGIDEDIVRALGVTESYWHQSALGDCQGATIPETHGCQSIGIIQIKGANIPPTHPGTWPYGYQSTAFNVDYTLAVIRTCLEGKETWLGNGYHAGDIWGCVGRWYSGDWYGGSLNYISTVQKNMADKGWLKPGF